MSKIHFIERDCRFERVPKSKDEWESGYWRISAAAAASLVGADVYFHSAKSEKSHFGGTFLGSRVQEGGEFDGKTVVRFRYSKEHRGVKAGPGGWGVERKDASARVSGAGGECDAPRCGRVDAALRFDGRRMRRLEEARRRASAARRGD